MQVSADVDERTLREIYLPAFERVVTQASPATVMCAYNRLNGVHASQNRWLLTEVLREQWGFTGAVIAFLLQWMLYEAVARGVETNDTLQLISVMSFGELWVPVAVVFLIVGVIVGVGGSLSAIRRFLQV